MRLFVTPGAATVIATPAGLHVMKKLVRWGALTLGLIGLAFAGLVFAARAGWLTPDDAILRARYALPESRFVVISGEPIHVVEQGQGPAIVLLHGSYGSLRMWNDWASELAPRYRVIRFDRPPMGLSGPDPAGRYDTEREMQILAELIRSQGGERVFLVATSSAGVVGAAYAAANPEQLLGLVLANVAVGAIATGGDHRSARLKLLLRLDPWLGGWRPAAFWQEVMHANFFRPEKVTPQLAREWSDLNNRAQRMPRATGGASPATEFERTPRDLAEIRTPTLLLWSQHDHELPVETVGARGLELLAASDKSLVVVPDCGHMMPLECGVSSARLAGAFFDRIAAGGAQQRD